MLSAFFFLFFPNPIKGIIIEICNNNGRVKFGGMYNLVFFFFITAKKLANIKFITDSGKKDVHGLLRLNIHFI